MSVYNDERHVSSKISNKLDNEIILKPMPCNDNSILDTTTKRTNDCSKLLTIQKLNQ